MLAQFRQNLRYAIRALCKQPAFTSIIVLTLGIGVAANTSIMSVLNAVVFERLPYPAEERLVNLLETFGGPDNVFLANYLNVGDWREQSETFDDIAAYTPTRSVTLTGDGESARLNTIFASPTYLTMLGARPAVGPASA